MEKSKRRGLFVSILIIVLVISLVGCGGAAGGNSDPSTLIVGSASLGGANYMIASGWAKLAEENTDKKFVVEATGGPVNNVQLIQNGDAHLGVASQVVAWEAVNGEGWTEGAKFDNIQGLWANNEQVWDGIVLANSNIRTFRDLEGKKISVGPAGSTLEVAASRVFETLGINAQFNYLGYTDACSALRDGMLDAVIGFGAAPRPAYLELEASVGIRFLEFDPGDLDLILEKYPQYSRGEVLAKHYDSLDKNIPGIADRYLYIVSKDLSEDTVYEFVKATMENVGQYNAVHNSLVDLTVENMYDDTITPHPGFIKYYKEIGLIK